MANEPVNQTASGVNNLADAAEKMSQMSVDIVTNMMTSSVDAFRTVNKISVDLTVNAINSLNQVLQGISSAIAPEK